MMRESFPPLKSLSQNFLRNGAVAENLVKKIPLSKDDAVVELGAGRGAITFLLADRVSKIAAVEIDAGHSSELKSKVLESGRTNIEVIHSDLMKTDWSEWGEILQVPFIVVGNLPYHISTPILFKIIENRSLLKAAYVMLQKEVANRLLGLPGTKEYGVLTVLIGHYARIRSLMVLGPGSFFPKPRVSSAFVELLFKADGSPPLRDEGLFRWVVRTAFGQRRKQIKNALTAPGRFDPEMIAKALELTRIDSQSRGEILTDVQFIELANNLDSLTQNI